MNVWTQRARRGARWGLQGLVILALTFALTEVAFRVVDHFKPIYLFPGDGYNRLRAKPHTVVRGAPTNALGFRDEEVATPKPEGQRRVVVIGDSHVFGVVPYEHLFTNLLEQRLRRDGDVDVVNMGIPRTSVHDYHALLVNEGLRLEPDVLVVCFFIGNDFQVWEDPAKRPDSFVLALLRYVFHVLPNYEGEIYGVAEYDDRTPSLSEDAYLTMLSGKLTLYAREDPAFEPAFDWVSEYLRRILAVCETWDIEPLVVLIPDEIQVDEAVRDWAFEAFRFAKLERYDFDSPSDRMRRFLEAEGVPVLDLLPVLRAASRDGEVYKPRDTHLNIRGNRIVAEEIYQRLSRSDRLPPSSATTDASTLKDKNPAR